MMSKNVHDEEKITEAVKKMANQLGATKRMNEMKHPSEGGDKQAERTHRKSWPPILIHPR
jgi:hypothetical protein